MEIYTLNLVVQDGLKFDNDDLVAKHHSGQKISFGVLTISP